MCIRDREKTMAALRSGVHTVIIPRDNVKDLEAVSYTHLPLAAFSSNPGCPAIAS